jgi:hypothetical protein
MPSARNVMGELDATSDVCIFILQVSHCGRSLKDKLSIYTVSISAGVVQLFT